MAKDSSTQNLQTLMEAIKSSELVEARIELITKLGVAVPPIESDLHVVLEFLTTLWEGFTCLDASQCMLNKAILDVAGKCLEGGNSSCQEKFLILGTQASEWCSKHLKMTLMSSGDSQDEEHYILYFQLLLASLNFSVGCLSLVENIRILGDDVLMISRDKFFCEVLGLVKDLATELKNIQSLTSELLKEVELVLESAIKVCKVYSQEVNLDLYGQINQDDGNSSDDKGASHLNHVANLIKHAIEKLSELGILAANSGGSLVTILNLSWKGVVSLLQLGGGSLSEKVNVGEIILILISLAIDSLRCATETWYSLHDQTISVTEAKRAFLPIKFYLINAARISSQYPQQAFAVYREVTRCILLLTTLRSTFSTENNLKNVCEALEELLKPTSLHLLKSLLNSAKLSNSQKLQILDWLFNIEMHLLPDRPNQVPEFQKCSLDEKIFSLGCEAMPTVRTFLLGRVLLFADVLKASMDLHEFVLLEITKKLQWFLDVFVDDEVYTFTLVLHIPTTYGEGKSLELTWEPFLFCFLNALKIFMISAYGTPAWHEIECFLLDNLFHPHSLCLEIVMELWCFLLRHAEISTLDMVVDKLCSVYKLVALSDSSFSPPSMLRKMARSMCLLLASCMPPTVDRVYRSIVTDDRSHLSLVMYAGLLMEGFPANLLSENLRVGATERIYQDYVHFVNEYVENPIKYCSSVVFGIPVVVLCSALQSRKIDASGLLDHKTINFLLAAIQTYKSSTDSVIKTHCCRLVSEALEIISTATHLYRNDKMEDVIIELQKLFISEPSSRESELQNCKPALASFMSSLAHMDMVEGEESVKTSSIRELYQMMLRERHWALIHLSISAFGYFAAHTSCRELWRFLPPDAALSFDLESGTTPNVERFMSELKVFLDKEMTLSAIAAFSPEQLDFVFKDGIILRELYQKNSYLDVNSLRCEIMRNDGENYSNKRRKLPNGFSRGMELLQNGVKIIGDELSQCQKNQQDLGKIDDKIFTQFSRLEDVVKNLAGLADNG